MKKQLILCLVMLTLLLAGHALADEITTCTNGPDERVISVVYLDPGYQVPCEVHYQKEGVTKTLWSAQSEVGYCEERAAAFVEKQRGWGWDCKSAAAQEMGAQ